MIRFASILSVCFISLLGSCQNANPAEQEWKDQLYKNLALVGARNWIVIAEASFPAYTGPGIKTMVSDKKSDEVLLEVLDILEEEAHVLPRIMISSELRSVTEDYAPGIKRYRNNINKMLPGRQHFELMSRTINSLIEDASKQFNVLVIKTKTALPYSNIYIELDSGYWNSESETALRKKLEARDAANRRQAGDTVLDVPLAPVPVPNPATAPVQPSSEAPPPAVPAASPADKLPVLPKDGGQPAPAAPPAGDKAPGIAPAAHQGPAGRQVSHRQIFMNRHIDKATEERLRIEAWVGDAILALYVREWILAEEGAINGKLFVEFTSNDFLRRTATPREWKRK